MELKAEGVSRRYFRKTGEANFFEAVKGADLTLEGGKVNALMGRSGSGKTTLLHMLGGLLAPTEGRILLDGMDLYAQPDEALSRVRNQRIAVIPQGRSAIDALTVRENVLLPGCLYGEPDGAAEQAVENWMEALGIASLADSSPRELSGGELRRMAIARALCHHPEVILADEPTGDLDDENTLLVLEKLKEAAERGAAVLIVSHESDTLRFADRAWRMDAGRLVQYQNAPGQ